MNLEDKLNAIVVRIKIPGLELERTNPAWIINAFTGGVLNDLLTVELAAESLLTNRPKGGLLAFLGWYLFEVRDVHRAGAVVWEVLRRNGLDGWATVFRFDADEVVWRSIFPRGIVMLTEDVTGETGACLAEASGVLALWTQILSRPNPTESDASKQ